jgi:tyrosine-protein kinase Etk/Wzc
MREAFSDLRSSVLLSVSEEPMKILVTSAGPSEGKTLAATNLAAALARTDRRVLLVDVDFRLPSVHEAFGQPLKPGLSEVLAGVASGGDALRPTPIPGLTILPAGHMPGDPAALLALPNFAEFLRNSTRHFDCVIFDTPPVMAVADATALGRGVDGVVFVVRANKTSRRTAQLALARIQETGARVLGVVLNGANLKHHGYYYHPYYRREYANYYTHAARF